MDRKIRKTAIAVFALSMLGIMLGAHASNVVLTEENVTRYEATHPEIWEVTKKLTEIEKMPASDDKEAKLKEQLARREEIIASNGWTDFWAYMDTRGRITEGLIPLMVLEKFKNHSAENRKKAQDSIVTRLQEKEFSQEEIKVLIKHYPALKKMQESLGNR